MYEYTHTHSFKWGSLENSYTLVHTQHPNQTALCQRAEALRWLRLLQSYTATQELHTHTRRGKCHSANHAVGGCLPSMAVLVTPVELKLSSDSLRPGLQFGHRKTHTGIFNQLSASAAREEHR